MVGENNTDERRNVASIIRRIQGLTILMCSLPANGKCRELFELGLAVDNSHALSLLSAPGDPDLTRGHQPWLESLWARADLAPDERRIVEWQNSADNMEVAIREMQSVDHALNGVWQLQ